jgi:hypothetical protein
MVDRYKLEGEILRLLTDEHGPEARTRRPIRGIDGTATAFDHPVPADYLQGMRTALQTARMAEGIARDWAREARGAGRSWSDVAEVLGRMLPDGEDPAIEAFVWVAPTPSMRFDRVTVGWRCSTCDQMITDHGPYESHPVDNESGHADGCARQAAEVAAWKIRAGWDDDE